MDLFDVIWCMYIMDWGMLVEESEWAYTQHLNELTLHCYNVKQAILQLTVLNALPYGTSVSILEYAGYRS
jgi:hypothetical protein